MDSPEDDKDLEKLLEEAYDAALEEELLFTKGDIEQAWQYGYQFAWLKLSKILLGIITSGIILWIINLVLLFVLLWMNMKT